MKNDNEMTREEIDEELRNRAMARQMQQHQEQKPQERSFREQLTDFKPHFQNPMKMLSEGLQSTANSPGIHGLQGSQDSIRDLLSLGLANNKPQGQGTAYDIGKTMGNVAGFLGGGELADLARLGIGATRAGAIPAIKGVLGSLEESPILRKVMGSGLFGIAAHPENRVGGALEGSALQGGLEGLGAAPRIIPWLAEKLNPINAAKEELGNIRNAYKASEAKQAEAYRPFNEIAAETKFENHKPLINELKKDKDYFGRTVNLKINKFDKDPSLREAHELQSTIFQRIKDERKSSSPDVDKIKALQDGRDLITKSLNERLKGLGGNIASEYKRGSQIHRNEIQPYFANKDVAHLIEGDIEHVQPKEIIGAIKPLKENKEHYLPTDHYLRDALRKMQHKQNWANAFSTPTYGLTSKLAEVAQNPAVSEYIQKMMSKVEPAKQYGRALINARVLK